MARSVRVAAQALAQFTQYEENWARIATDGRRDIEPIADSESAPNAAHILERWRAIERQLDDANRTLRDGLWVSTARRALIDAAREAADPDQLVSAARDARARAMLAPDDLGELRRHPPFAGAGL